MNTLTNNKYQHICVKIEYFLKKFNIKVEKIKHLKGGTNGDVYLINNYYVIKFLTPEQLKSEFMFFKTYNFSPYQKFFYVAKNYEYIVYKFFKSEPIKKPRIVLKKVIYQIKKQKKCNLKGYGYINELTKTFDEFLLSEVNYSFEATKNFLSQNDYEFIKVIIKKYMSFKQTKMLLHGDMGSHNLLCYKNKFCIIDPDPVCGDNLYDCFSLICSNLIFLKNFSLKRIIKTFNVPYLKAYYMLLIVLFIRLGRCYKYHNQDLDEYLKYWEMYTKNKAI